MEAEDDTTLSPRGNVLDTICCGLRGESGSQGEGGLAGGKIRRKRRRRAGRVATHD